MGTTKITLRISEDFDEAVEDHIGYGYKSEFVREAMLEKLERETDGGVEVSPTPAGARQTEETDGDDARRGGRRSR